MDHLLLDAEGHVRSGWKALAFFAAVPALGFLLLTSLSLAGFRGSTHGPLWEVVPAGLVLAVSWAATRLEQRPLASLGLALNGRWLLDLALGVAAGAALIALTALALRAMGGFTWTRNPQATGGALLAGAWLYLWVGVNEEAFFRGYPFQRLAAGLGPWGAQLLFAALFALVHWGNPGVRAAGPLLKAVTSLNIALAAILLGLAYLRTRSLAAPIGLHWAWNWTQGSLLGFSVSGTGDSLAPLKPLRSARPEWLTGGAVGLEGSLACTVVCLAFIAGLLLWKGRRDAADA